MSVCPQTKITNNLLKCFPGNIGTNPGLAALWEDERQRHKERGDSTDISPPHSPGNGC